MHEVCAQYLLFNFAQLRTESGLDLLQVSSSDLSKKTRESERGKIKRATFSLARFLEFFSRDQRMRLVASPNRGMLFHDL